MQQGRHELGIVGEMPGPVADHARHRQGEQIGRGFGIEQQAHVFSPEADGALIHAGVFIVQNARFGQIAGVAGAVGGIGIERAVVAVGFTRRNSERNDEAIARGREQIGNGAGCRKLVAFRHVERQAVGKNAAGMDKRNDAILRRLRIQFDAG